jgi:hypothetical protein
MSGMDMLVSAVLNAAGLDMARVKELAAKLATDDTINKVLKFSQDLEEHNRMLKLVYEHLIRENDIGTDKEPEPDPRAGYSEFILHAHGPGGVLSFGDGPDL